MATVGGEYKELDAAAKKVRDTLIVRTQLMALPMGDKKKYEAVLKAAYGGRIDDGKKFSIRSIVQEGEV